MRANIDWVTRYSALSLATVKSRVRSSIDWLRRFALLSLMAVKAGARSGIAWLRHATSVSLTTVKTYWKHPVVIRTAIGALVAALLLFIFSKAISLGSVFQQLEHLNVALALLCGAVFLGAYVVRSMRWRLFLAPYTMSVRDAILIYQVSIFVNWLLPIRGGEIVKAWLARKRSGIPISEALSTVAMDKLMDLLPSLVLLVILPFMPFHLGDALWGLLLFVAGVFLLAILFLALCVWRRELAMRLMHRMFAILPARLREKVEPFAEGFVDALLRLVAQPRLLLIATGITTVAVACDALFAWLAFLAIGAPVSFAVVLFGYTLYNLAYMLPTPPGQIGSNEVIGLLVFSGIFSISRLSVASMFVFSHPWTALLMIVSGLVCASLLGVNLRSLLGLKRGPDAGPDSGPGKGPDTGPSAGPDGGASQADGRQEEPGHLLGVS